MNESKNKTASYAWKAAGWCVAAVSIAYIVYKLIENPIGETLPAFNAISLGKTAVYILIYSLLNILLAFAWARFVIASSGNGTPGRYLIELYLRSGIVKYLPGNIFHLAGRHVLAGRAGIGQGPVLAANIYEMALIAFTALIAFISVLLSGELNDAGAIIGHFRRGFATTVIIICTALGFAAGAVIYCRKKAPAYLSAALARSTLEALPVYLVFFIASSFILSGLLAFYGNDVVSLSFFSVFGVFCLSWIAGFLVPGAPGGFGVRETVIVLMLGGAVGEGPALGAALLLRMVTAAGDVCSFVYSFFIKKNGER